MQTFDAVIVGAGPAGLTTAYTLAKAGRSVLVVEQDP
ncbi:MAG: FAD-dependent oxidoreductase, partial [Stellaceae bacterium]